MDFKGELIAFLLATIFFPLCIIWVGVLHLPELLLGDIFWPHPIVRSRQSMTTCYGMRSNWWSWSKAQSIWSMSLRPLALQCHSWSHIDQEREDNDGDYQKTRECVRREVEELPFFGVAGCDLYILTSDERRSEQVQQPSKKLQNSRPSPAILNTINGWDSFHWEMYISRQSERQTNYIPLTDVTPPVGKSTFEGIQNGTQSTVALNFINRWNSSHLEMNIGK